MPVNGVPAVLFVPLEIGRIAGGEAEWVGPSGWVGGVVVGVGGWCEAEGVGGGVAGGGGVVVAVAVVVQAGFVVGVLAGES